MVYTVTFNPSIDYKVYVEDFSKGTVNRSVSETICAGGKGINVSKMLNNLGINNIALGFVAGFTGEQICGILKSDCVNNCMWKIADGISRINVKISDNLTDGETEVNAKGPSLTAADISKLKKVVDSLKEGDCIVLAGSILDGVEDTIYKELIQGLRDKGIRSVVDATKALLKNTLSEKPFLIKPNKYELEEIFEVTINSFDDAAEYAVKLREQGALNVLVSMGAEGAVLAAQGGEVYGAYAPEGDAIDTVGAGDSMVAGFIAGFMQTKDYKESLRLSVAAGSASAFCDKIADKESVYRLMQDIEIFQIG